MVELIQQQFKALLKSINNQAKSFCSNIKAFADNKIRYNFCFNALLYILIILILILPCIQAQEFFKINSEPKIQKQNSQLNETYVIAIYASPSCDLGGFELLSEVLATTDGCKCNEQLYAQRCTESQKKQQNCEPINPSDSFSQNLWPFQKNNDLRNPLKICIIKSNSSMQQQIDHDNNCTTLGLSQYGNDTDYICIEKEGPISKLLIQKQENITRKVNNRIVVLEQNYREPLTNIFVTNGFCNNRQNSSNYELNIQYEDDCQFKGLITSIANFSMELILEVNQKLKQFKQTRPYFNLSNQDYIINGKKQYWVPPVCRVKNKIQKQQDNILNFELTLRIVAILQIIVNLYNLYVIYSVISQKPPYCYCLWTCLILLINVVSTILPYIYKDYLDKNCLNFELAEINNSYSILILVFQFLGMIFYYRQVSPQLTRVHNQQNDQSNDLKSDNSLLQGESRHNEYSNGSQLQNGQRQEKKEQDKPNEQEKSNQKVENQQQNQRRKYSFVDLNNIYMIKLIENARYSRESESTNKLRVLSRQSSDFELGLIQQKD